MGSSVTISKYGSRRFLSVGFDCSIQSTLNNSCSVGGRLCDNISFSALRPVGVQTYNTAGYSRLYMNCSLCWNLPVQLTPDFELSGAIQVHDFRPQIPRWWANPSHLVHSRSSIRRSTMALHSMCVLSLQRGLSMPLFSLEHSRVLFNQGMTL